MYSHTNRHVYKRLELQSWHYPRTPVLVHDDIYLHTPVTDIPTAYIYTHTDTHTDTHTYISIYY